MQKKFSAKARRLPAVLLAILGFGLASVCQAVVFDWDAVTWTPGSLSQSFDVDPANAGNDVTITITGATAFISTYPQLTKNQTGGLVPAQFGLQLNLDFAKDTDFIAVTVTFSPNYIYGVDQAVFSVFDVDKDPAPALRYHDQIRNIQARYNADPYFAASLTAGPDVTIAGSGTAQTMTGNALTADTSSAANATMDFGASILTEATFSYGNDLAAQNNPQEQSITFADFSFRPRPIPEVHPGLAAIALCGVVIGLQHFRNRKIQALA